MISNILIAKCEFCGACNCIAHTKYTDRCVSCGKRYATYANYKCLQKSKPTAKRAIRLERIVDDYKMLKRHGYKVPRDIP